MAELTDLKITRLKATGSDYALRDGAGLYLRVSKRGSKAFVYRYRSASGRNVWLTVGAYGAVSLHEARQQAAEYALMRKQGQDPAEHEQTRIAVTEAVAAERAMVPTFENITRSFYQRAIVRRRRRPEQFLWAMEKHVFPVIGATRIAELKRGDIAGAINLIVDAGSPVMANRVLGMVKLATAYATEQGHIEADPAAGITRASAGGREKARERVLSWDEIKAFLVALDVESMATRKLSPLVRIALKWLLFTGQRISETLMTEWVHLDAAIWTLPAGNTKSGRDHFVDLTTQTTALLDELRPLTWAGKYLFESSQKPGQPISRYAVERALLRLLNDDTLRMSPFTPHDLRRTAVTRMSDIGIAPHVIEKIVNHKMAGVMGIYNRSEYLPERKAAIEAWNNRLQELTGAGEKVGSCAVD